MTEPDRGPRNVLVVGWFPAADATTSGRFVADQVAALRATGAVRPSVVSFENAAVRGPGRLRDRQAEAIVAAGRAAVGRASPFNARGVAGPDGVDVARLAIAGGETPASGPDHRAVHRTVALRSLLDQSEGRAWDLVHAHVGYPEGVVGAMAGAELGVPFVLTEHASFLATLLAEPIVKARYLEAARAASRVIAVSRMLAGELIAAFRELDGRIVVIPNTVAVEEFAGAPVTERVPGELLWVGARSDAKGTATLLQAFAIVHRERPATTLRLVGQSTRPSTDAGWRRMAAELGVAAAVRIEPAADRAGVVAAMGRADLFVHPSLRETFGVVAVEALAAGLPVVAADSGGVAEVLGDEPEALGGLVAPRDPEALAAAVIGALDRRDAFDPDRLRAYAVDHFGAATVARRIVELYETVIAEHARAAGGVRPTGRPRPSDPIVPRDPARRPARTVVVAFSRAELDRAIARFPRWVLRDVTIVTSGPPGRPAGLVVAPTGTESRLAELLGWGAPATSTLGRLGRRIRRAARRVTARLGVSSGAAGDNDLLATLTATLAGCLPSVAGPEAPLVVCVGGFDHLVAAPFIADGRAIAAPGGLRWLADVRLTTAQAGDSGAAGAAWLGEPAGTAGQGAPDGSRDA